MPPCRVHYFPAVVILCKSFLDFCDTWSCNCANASIIVKYLSYFFVMFKCSVSFADLQLAAELGKALLERNRDLEAQLIHAQQIDADQQLEIEVI